MSESCSHPVQYFGLCSICGETLHTHSSHSTKGDNRPPGVTAPMDNITVNLKHPEITASHTEVIEQHWLDSIKQLANRKLHLVLDLDHTLIHATAGNAQLDQYFVHDGVVLESSMVPMKWHKEGGPLPPEEEMRKDTDVIHRTKIGGVEIFFKFRPKLFDFLYQMRTKYILHMFTMGRRTYAIEILKIIDPDGSLFSHRILTRDESSSLTSKSLAHIFPCDDSLTLVVDDSPSVWNKIPNVIAINPYVFFPDDLQHADYDRAKLKHVDAFELIHKDDDETLVHMGALLGNIYSNFMTSFQQKYPQHWKNLQNWAENNPIFDTYYPKSKTSSISPSKTIASDGESAEQYETRISEIDATSKLQETQETPTSSKSQNTEIFADNSESSELVSAAKTAKRITHFHSTQNQSKKTPPSLVSSDSQSQRGNSSTTISPSLSHSPSTSFRTTQLKNQIPFDVYTLAEIFDNINSKISLEEIKSTLFSDCHFVIGSFKAPTKTVLAQLLMRFGGSVLSYPNATKYLLDQPLELDPDSQLDTDPFGRNIKSIPRTKLLIMYHNRKPAPSHTRFFIPTKKVIKEYHFVSTVWFLTSILDFKQHLPTKTFPVSSSDKELDRWTRQQLFILYETYASFFPVLSGSDSAFNSSLKLLSIRKKRDREIEKEVSSLIHPGEPLPSPYMGNYSASGSNLDSSSPDPDENVKRKKSNLLNPQNISNSINSTDNSPVSNNSHVDSSSSDSEAPEWEDEDNIDDLNSLSDWNTSSEEDHH